MDSLDLVWGMLLVVWEIVLIVIVVGLTVIEPTLDKVKSYNYYLVWHICILE